MARSSKQGSKSKKKSGGKPPPGRDWSFGVDGQTLWRVGVGLAVVGVGVGWLLGFGALQDRMNERRMDPVSVRFAWPAWLEAQRGDDGSTVGAAFVQRWLTSMVATRAGVQPYDQEGLEAAHAALAVTGWFRELEGVVREPGNEVRVIGAWRAPSAFVEKRGRRYLVGGEEAAAMLVPVPDDVELSGFVTIREPLSGPPLLERGTDDGLDGIAYGQPWPRGDVQAALRLVRALAERGFNDLSSDARIRAIDLSEHGATGVVSLISARGARYVWGALPGEPSQGEMSLDNKLANLRVLLDEPGFDRARRVYDLRSSAVTVENMPGG
jgi:hypothetical protein